MYRLYLFLFKYRVALIFLILESISFWLIVQNNKYQSAAFFNSANAVSANLLSISAEVRGYFSLKKTNEELAKEIGELRTSLEQKRNLTAGQTSKDTTFVPYRFITARVISNSVYSFNNYLTINVGSDDGIIPDMGVIGNNGIVGKIKYTSQHFSVVTSLLHSNFLISSKVENKINLCSTQWDGVSPLNAKLLFVPPHIQLEEGDSVFTSGFNSVFPEDILIGKVTEIKREEGSTFLDIQISLSTRFANLSYVQVISNTRREELDSLDNFIESY